MCQIAHKFLGNEFLGNATTFGFEISKLTSLEKMFNLKSD